MTSITCCLIVSMIGQGEVKDQPKSFSTHALTTLVIQLSKKNLLSDSFVVMPDDLSDTLVVRLRSVANHFDTQEWTFNSESKQLSIKNEGTPIAVGQHNASLLRGFKSVVRKLDFEMLSFSARSTAGGTVFTVRKAPLRPRSPAIYRTDPTGQIINIFQSR